MKVYSILFSLFGLGSVYAQSPGLELPDLSVERLLTAPLSVTVEGKKLFLEGRMSIDFMPFVPQRPRPVRINCYLSTVDKSELPPSLKADAIWIVYKHESSQTSPYHIKAINLDTTPQIWKSWLTEDKDYSYTYKKLYRASEGNFLGVGGTGDLIVRIKDNKGNKWYLRTRATVRKHQ